MTSYLRLLPPCLPHDDGLLPQTGGPNHHCQQRVTKIHGCYFHSGTSGAAFALRLWPLLTLSYRLSPPGPVSLAVQWAEAGPLSPGEGPDSLGLLSLVVGTAPGVPPRLPLGQRQVRQKGRQGAFDLVGSPAQGMLRGTVVGTFPIEADVIG